MEGRPNQYSSDHEGKEGAMLRMRILKGMTGCYLHTLSQIEGRGDVRKEMDAWGGKRAGC